MNVKQEEDKAGLWNTTDKNEIITRKDPFGLVGNKIAERIVDSREDSSATPVQELYKLNEKRVTQSGAKPSVLDLFLLGCII